MNEEIALIPSRFSVEVMDMAVYPQRRSWVFRSSSVSKKSSWM